MVTGYIIPHCSYQFNFCYRYEEKDSLAKELNIEISKYKDQLESVTNEIKIQRAKNDDVEKLKKENEEAQKSFLGRLFSDVIDVDSSATTKLDHSEWLKNFAEKVDKLARV